MKFAGPAARSIALAFLIFFAGGVLAQAFPAKPVRIIVPFPPGGGADALARIMAPYLTKLWGQPVIVENKAGASGQIGAEAVASAPADGYTLMMSSTASLTEKNAHQFAPVSLVSASPYVIVANPRVPAGNVRELIEYAKKNPGKLTFGSSGTGAASHLSAELFKSLAGIDMLHVPYKGTGQAVTDLLAGQIDLMFAPAQTVMQHVQGGKLKAFAVTSAKRSATLPDLPPGGAIRAARIRSDRLVRIARARRHAQGPGREAFRRFPQGPRRAGSEATDARARRRALGRHAGAIRAIHPRGPGEMVETHAVARDHARMTGLVSTRRPQKGHSAGRAPQRPAVLSPHVIAQLRETASEVPHENSQTDFRRICHRRYRERVDSRIRLHRLA